MTLFVLLPPAASPQLQPAASPELSCCCMLGPAHADDHNICPAINDATDAHRDSAACGGDLKVCIAEVTNTPWGARVTFLFDPAGQDVPKSMHVSPFMDMQATWWSPQLPPSSVHHHWLSCVKWLPASFFLC